MTTLTFPTLTKAVPHRFEWWGNWPAQGAASPFDATEQTYELGACRWMCQMTFDPLVVADEALLAAWEAQMRGPSGRVYLWNMVRAAPRGTITTSGVTLNGAISAGATSITLAGAGNTKTLLRGDLLSIGYELKRVVAADYTSNAGGAMASVLVEPPFRAAQIDTAAVTLTAPKAIFRLEGEKQGGGFRANASGVPFGRREYQFVESFT